MKLNFTKHYDRQLKKRICYIDANDYVKLIVLTVKP